MRFLRVEVASLLPQLRGELVALLASLPAPDWESATSCPGWSVHDVAAHLLGVDVGNISARRDGWALGPGPGAACELRTTTDGAIRSFVRDPAAPAFTWRGDPELAHAVSQARAILGRSPPARPGAAGPAAATQVTTAMTQDDGERPELGRVRGK